MFFFLLNHFKQPFVCVIHELGYISGSSDGVMSKSILIISGLFLLVSDIG